MSALPQTMERRNFYLYKFFDKIFPTKITLLDSNPNAPAVIYNEDKCLSCYVHNFELRFTDSPDKGNILYTINLDTPENYDVEKILVWFKDSRHRKMSKIKLTSVPAPVLYLSGYNFKDRANKQGRYPVFSTFHPKLYFSETKANEVASELRQEGYTISIC